MFYKVPLVIKKKADSPEMKLYVKYGWNLCVTGELMGKEGYFGLL